MLYVIFSSHTHISRVSLINLPIEKFEQKNETKMKKRKKRNKVALQRNEVISNFSLIPSQISITSLSTLLCFISCNISTQSRSEFLFSNQVVWAFCQAKTWLFQLVMLIALLIFIMDFRFILFYQLKHISNPMLFGCRCYKVGMRQFERKRERER